MKSLTSIACFAVTSLSILGAIGSRAVAAEPLAQTSTATDAKSATAGKEARGRGYANWSPEQMTARRKAYGLIGPGPQHPLPEARFPSYLKKPKNIEEILPAARAAVTQTGGRVPLGLANPGDVVLIVTPYNADPVVQQAMLRAYEERKVKAYIQYEHDLAGVSKADMETIALAEAVMTIGDGQHELNYFFERTGQMADPEAGRQWIKQRDPALYKATWPDIRPLNDRLVKTSRDFDKLVDKALVKFMTQHPEITQVYMGFGARNKTRRRLGPYADKFFGSYTYLNHYDIASKVPDFPSDVWRLVETKTIDSLGFTDRLEVTDPEGTALAADLTADVAQRWAKGVYQQGHLYMFPSQATGRWPYSLIKYPAYDEDKGFMPLLQVEVAGVIASTNSHRATHPRMEVYLDKGRVVKVAGGGWYGEGFRLLLNYPGTQNLTWPFTERSGYWWLYEAGTGTNPKYFKHPGDMLEWVSPSPTRLSMGGGNLSERNVGGVIHWALGSEAEHGPEVPGKPSPKSIEFGKKYNVPIGHSMHQHNVLPTFQVRIRGSGQWQTLIEHGNLASLNDPEVRALAARYGNPDELLRKDFIHAIPGITTAGKYEDYAKDPGTWWKQWARAIEAGTSPYLKP